jgi:hypothetical protein
VRSVSAALEFVLAPMLGLIDEPAPAVTLHCQIKTVVPLIFSFFAVFETTPVIRSRFLRKLVLIKA